jgi:hypothetical protein
MDPRKCQGQDPRPLRSLPCRGLTKSDSYAVLHTVLLSRFRFLQCVCSYARKRSFEYEWGANERLNTGWTVAGGVCTLQPESPRTVKVGSSRSSHGKCCNARDVLSRRCSNAAVFSCSTAWQAIFESHPGAALVLLLPVAPATVGLVRPLLFSKAALASGASFGPCFEGCLRQESYHQCSVFVLRNQAE